MSDESVFPTGGEPRESLLPAPGPLEVEAQQELHALADRRLFLPAQQAGYELLRVGVSGLPYEKTIDTGWAKWRIVDYRADPTTAQFKGRHPFPDKQADRLQKLLLAGVSPELAWLAHELPPDYREGDPLPLVPPPRHMREKDERLRLRLKDISSQAIKAAGMFIAAPLMPLVLLDPVIFGGVKHPNFPAVEWCVLAQWDWE